jgi:hypothetical protein
MSKRQLASREASSDERLSAFDLRDLIHIKLGQAKGICWVIHGVGDLANVGEESIKNSLDVVDELLEEAEKAVDALYEQSAEKEVQLGLIQEAEKAFNELQETYLERTPKEPQS